jgi:hypothetical protein
MIHGSTSRIRQNKGKTPYPQPTISSEIVSDWLTDLAQPVAQAASRRPVRACIEELLPDILDGTIDSVEYSTAPLASKASQRANRAIGRPRVDQGDGHIVTVALHCKHKQGRRT